VCHKRRQNEAILRARPEKPRPRVIALFVAPAHFVAISKICNKACRDGRSTLSQMTLRQIKCASIAAFPRAHFVAIHGCTEIKIRKKESVVILREKEREVDILFLYFLSVDLSVTKFCAHFPDETADRKDLKLFTMLH
jgi:hypothetical protein